MCCHHKLQTCFLFENIYNSKLGTANAEEIYILKFIVAIHVDLKENYCYKNL